MSHPRTGGEVSVTWKWLAVTCFGMITSVGIWLAYQGISHQQLPMHNGASHGFQQIGRDLQEIKVDTRDTSKRVRSIETQQIRVESQIEALDSDLQEIKDEVKELKQ